VALVAGVSYTGVRSLRSQDVRPAADASVRETVFAQPADSPSASASPKPSVSPAPSPSTDGRAGPGEGAVWYDAEQWGYPFPGDAPGCIDGLDEAHACAHIHILMSGINGNRFIAVDLWRTPDEPKVGDTVTYYTKVWDDDPYCCRVEMSIDTAPDPTIIRCKTPDPTTGLVRTGGTVTKKITWKPTKAGTFVVNVHARGNCGHTGGSEQTGWQYVIVYPAKASPSPAPTPSPTPSPSQSPSVSPSPSPTVTPTA
jgi:hypothetical protein